MENSDYCNHTGYIKDCYLIFDSRFSERCLYGKTIERCFDCMDCFKVFDCELCYEMVGGYKCHACAYSQDCYTCNDCSYCYNCTGCQSCFGCVNLRNKEYCIFNEQMDSKGEWEERVRELHSQYSHKQLQQKLSDFRQTYPVRWMQKHHTEECTGDYLSECKNSFSCFDCEYLQDCKYCQDVKKVNELNYVLHDITHFGGNLSESYQCCSIGNTVRNALFCGHCWNNVTNLLYCMQCINGSHHLFGCVGLNRAGYCIFNKQYTKEEYEDLVPKIIEHMEKTGEWGEFFPVKMSQYAYNETVAQEYVPLTKNEVLARNWTWKDEADEMPEVEKIIPATQLPDSIDDIPDDILNWVIKCETTERPFKIVKQELDFYRNRKLPIPHCHPDERHRRRMTLRNPRKLWERQCGKCDKEIQTTYSPERPETVYCEECYLKEVY